MVLMAMTLEELPTSAAYAEFDVMGLFLGPSST
jgi:multidrug transporter EmrE-like cation transporter